MRFKVKIGDLLVYLLAAALVAVGLMGMYAMGAHGTGKSVVVELDGKEVYSCRIYEGMAPVEFRVDAGNGRYNVVSVTYEEVKIKEANCPDQVCVKLGAIRHVGQAIVCLPHRVVVKIKGSYEDTNDVDDIAF